MDPTDAASVDTSSRVSMAVARKTLDATRQQGEAMVELIKSAADVARTSSGSTAAVTGVGRTIDTQA